MPHVGLVLDAEIMRAVARVQQEFVRDEELEQHAADIDDTGMQLRAGDVVEQVRAEIFTEMVQALIEILQHHVEVVDLGAADMGAHAHAPMVSTMRNRASLRIIFS